MRIIFLHHAGGDQYAYKKFKPILEAMNWEGIYYDLPGHGDRFTEPLADEIHAITNEIYENLLHKFKGDYAIFGTSLGSLIGYLLCIKMEQNRKTLPKHLFFTSRRYPDSHLNFPMISHLPEDEFWYSINKYGGCPPALIKNKELREVYEPLLRADFKAIERYRNLEKRKLNIPATILFGKKDNMTFEEMVEWQDYFENDFEVIECEGGHFFCYINAKEMVDIMQTKLNSK